MMGTVIPAHVRELDAAELGRAIASARNKRDAYAEGREPAWVKSELAALLAEQDRRRMVRRTRREAAEREAAAR